MLTRDEILLKLGEPIGTLTAEELMFIDKIAQQDSEIAAALRFYRHMGLLKEDEVFAPSQVSDADFIVAMRERLETGERRLLARPVFATPGLFTALSTVGVLLVAVVFSVGHFYAPATFIAADSTSVAGATHFAQALEVPLPILPDSANDESLNADSLANYLGVADLAETWNTEDDSTAPLADELLALDSQTLEEVLHKLETTNFF